MPSKKRERVLLKFFACLIFTGLVLCPSFGLLRGAEKRSLWKIRSKNNVVYLLGSIHYLKPENYPLDPAMEAAFKDAKRLVFEINLDSVEGNRGQQLMLSRGTYLDGTTLKDHVSSETYSLAGKELGGMGLDIGVFNLIKPWFIALALTAEKLKSIGFDPDQGIDRYFHRKAKKEKKEIDGLETLEYQIDLFDKMPERTQESLLLQTLKEIDSMEGEVDKVVKAWSSGDLGALEAVLVQGMKEYPDLYRRLILDRNRAWLPKIESYLSGNENYLVVVGAGHLAGKDGLIEILRSKSYSVEQL